MRLVRILINMSFALLWAGGIFAQSILNPLGNGKLFPDDPIAAALDSLIRVQYFEKGLLEPPKLKQSKYNFSADSVPMYGASEYEARLKKLDAASPFDLEYNDAVKSYIDMYANKKRPLVSRLMALSQLYFPMMEETLDRYGLPLELKYLAIVESALNSGIKSRAGAMGLWQFMYGTGKIYNLKITSYVDERCDPYKATVAACEYLKFLYEMFGDWQMVLAAYNSGPGNVNKAIRRSGGKHTYWEVRPFLPVETQGYVPAFIAVNYVMNHTAEHNLYSNIPKHTFAQIDTVKIKQQISFEQIANVLDIPMEEIKFLNPQYKKGIIPFSADDAYTLVLPTAKMGSFITNEQAIYNYLKINKPLSQDVIASQEVMKTHIVKKGERLYSIAKKYKCTSYDIQTWNNLKSQYVKPGQKLTIYIQKASSGNNNTNNTSVRETQTEPEKTKIAEASVVNSTEGVKYYTIQKGDNLWSISQKNSITVDKLKELNGITGKYMLHPGQKLKVQ